MSYEHDLSGVRLDDMSYEHDPSGVRLDDMAYEYDPSGVRLDDMAYGHDDIILRLDDMSYEHDLSGVRLDDMSYEHDPSGVRVEDMNYEHDLNRMSKLEVITYRTDTTNQYYERIVLNTVKNNIILENAHYVFLTNIDTSLAIRPLPIQYEKVNVQLTTYAGIKFVPPVDTYWESNANLLSMGAFATEADAVSDAVSKNYQDYDVKSILNQFGVVYYTYRVNFDNEIFCHIGPTAPIPSHGLIHGG